MGLILFLFSLSVIFCWCSVCFYFLSEKHEKRSEGGRSVFTFMFISVIFFIIFMASTLLNGAEYIACYFQAKSINLQLGTSLSGTDLFYNKHLVMRDIQAKLKLSDHRKAIKVEGVNNEP